MATPDEDLLKALGADGDVGRDALKFLELQSATDAASNAALKAKTRGEEPPKGDGDDAGAGDAADDDAAAGEPDGDDDAQVDDPEGELETREDPDAEEAQAAGLRLADYTRKTQAVAEKQRALEAKEAEIGSKLGALDTAIAEARRVLQTTAPDPREMAELEARDPGRAALLKLEQRERQDAINRAVAQRNRVAAEQQAARVERETTTLMTMVPAFKDPETGEFNDRLYQKVRAHAKAKGLDDSRFESVVDAPWVAMAYESMVAAERARKAKATGERIKAAPRTLAPGGGGAPARTTGRQATAAQAEARAAAALKANPNSTEAIAARFLARDQVQRAAKRGPRIGGS